ncbi:MAG: class I SAM-dependent methyltransferase [Planctomycetota bacterium]|nr:class I SAM-dependent methyltransferase [Planctomycetota bacterium]
MNRTSSPASDLAPIVEDLELGDESLDMVELRSAQPDQAATLGAACGENPLLAVLPGLPDDKRLAALRDALWPQGHLLAIYRIDANGHITRLALKGSETLKATTHGPERTVLYVRSLQHALGQTTTRAKFDANAEGWNGVPGSPTYGHYRWMRKLLSDVSQASHGERVLDAGCGAGWVGIEAALAGGMASAFDPSPAMVEIAKRNAETLGVDLDARVGFVEDVPFNKPFQVVLNSGVISFAPDADVFIDRLDALVESGGTLVIGDLNPESRGFARRRVRPLLPARELNGLPRSVVEQKLTDRGYVIESKWYYQITFPLPEFMALSEQRLGGIGCGLALLKNKLATRMDHATGSHAARWFDSWIIRARKPGSPG